MKLLRITRLICIHLLILSAAVSITAAQESPGSWDFSPSEDAFTDDALLDLRFLNERQSGETGFVKLSADGDDFVRGDGQPIRFWACGSDVYQRSPAEMDVHCRFLAKLGVNLVRLHATVADTKEGAAITDVNEKEIDGIFRFIKAAKHNGIYVLISPYYGQHPTPTSWKLEGYGTDKKPWGAIFVDPHMQEGYKAWTQSLYTRPNSYTGLAIKDDPTVVILQIHNEDSMLFWTFQDLPPPQARRLGKAFGDWLATKHGSLEKALAVWDGAAQPGDDLAAGVVGLVSTWHLTQDFEGGLGKRVRDQTEFIGQHQRKFYADMGKYLREELGCRQLLNATNWRTASDARLKDIERYTYAALDIDAENEYYGSDYQHIGENNGYRIDPDHFLVNESALKKPLEITTNFRMQTGHPFIVTETSWKNPNLYQTEGPFLVAAYQSLNGLDAVFWFSATEPRWCLDPRFMFWRVRDQHPIHKWTCSTPTLFGMFPANALLYRLGYLKQADAVSHEERPLAALWDRQPPRIDDNEIYGVGESGEELKTATLPNGRTSRAAFLVGRVETVLGGDAEKSRSTDYSGNLDGQRKTIQSSTGQIELNYDVGLCRVDSPKAQGMAGFLKTGGEKFKLGDATIKSQNEYAAVSVVAMDDLPLAGSKKILVQVGTTARLKGWKTKPSEFDFDKRTMHGEQIVNTGEPPWQIADTLVELTIANPGLKKATRLDVNGYAAESVPITRQKDAISLTLPRNTMYLVLQ